MVQGPQVSRASECKTHKEATNRTKTATGRAGLSVVVCVPPACPSRRHPKFVVGGVRPTNVCVGSGSLGLAWPISQPRSQRGPTTTNASISQSSVAAVGYGVVPWPGASPLQSAAAKPLSESCWLVAAALAGRVDR